MGTLYGVAADLVTQGRSEEITVADVAARADVPAARVLRTLLAAGIPARGRHGGAGRPRLVHGRLRIGRRPHGGGGDPRLHTRARRRRQQCRRGGHRPLPRRAGTRDGRRGARRAGADATGRGRHDRLRGGARRPRRPGAERLRAGTAPGRGGPVLAGFQPSRRRDRPRARPRWWPSASSTWWGRRPGASRCRCATRAWPWPASSRPPGPAAVLGGGRVVKTIGDEVFFAAPTAEAACRIGLEICRAVAEDEVLPPARGAVGIGPAFPREGDYFGPLVNLLARLAKVGAPGEMVATEAVAVHLHPRHGICARWSRPSSGASSGRWRRSSWSVTSPAPELPPRLTPWTGLVNTTDHQGFSLCVARCRKRQGVGARYDGRRACVGAHRNGVIAFAGAAAQWRQTSFLWFVKRFSRRCHATLPARWNQVCPASGGHSLAAWAGCPPWSNGREGSGGAGSFRAPASIAPAKRLPEDRSSGDDPVPAIACSPRPSSPLGGPGDTDSSGLRSGGQRTHNRVATILRPPL